MIYRVVVPKRAKRIKESVDWYRRIGAEYEERLKEDDVKKEKDLKSRINTLVKQETDV